MTTMGLPERPRVWVVAPRRVRHLLGKLSGEEAEWCYFGVDPSQVERVSRLLPGIKRVGIGADLNEVARAIKQPFLDWIVQIGRGQSNRLNWWAYRLASKSPLQTDFFLLVSYTQLIDAWLGERRPGASRIVVTEDPWLRWVLRRKLAADGRVAFVGGHVGDCLLDVACCLGRVPLALGRALLPSLRSWALARWWRLRGDGERARSGGRSVVIYTWIDQRSFSTAGAFQDPYTGRLEEILRARGESVRRLMPLPLPKGLPRGLLRELPRRFIITPRYMCLGDLARSACSWFGINGLGRFSTFQGWDYTPLLYRELLREWSSPAVYLHRLWYFTMRRVAEALGGDVKCIIYPFENQPWEKLHCLAWQERAPRVKLIGYQHTSVRPMLLPYCLGEGEIATAPLPNLIVANGEVSLELLKKAGFPESRLANGGALRYEYLYSVARRLERPASSGAGCDGRGRIVLVTFPSSAHHAKSLLADLLEQFKEPLLIGDANGTPVRLVFKCHPVLPIENLRPGPVELAPWISVSHEPVDRELSRADLLLYVPPTTSWWEGFLLGIPVLKYQGDFLDIDADVGGRVPMRVCSRETLRASIEELLRRPAVRSRPDPRVLEEAFSRVNEELWASVVREEESA